MNNIILKFIHKIIGPYFVSRDLIWQNMAITSKNALTYAIHQKYWENKKKNNRCVYTCMTGGYDGIILHAYLDSSYDYICFTDNKQLLSLGRFGAWQIRPLVFSEMDNQLNNRWHKTHPHECLKEYETSVYVDSNVDILSSYYYEIIESRKNENIIIPAHYNRDCVYKEAKEIIKAKKDTRENVNKMVVFLKEQKMPENIGLTENNLIYRRHNDPSVIRIMEEWWGLITKYCKRDQLSLSYCLWKAGINVGDIVIPNARLDKKNYSIIQHN